MPKIKETTGEFYRRVRSEHPNVFRADNSVLFCLLCDKEVKAKQMCQVTQHLSTAIHQAAIQRKNQAGSGTSQSLLTTLSTDLNRNASEFAMDLTECFTKANIALYKARHPDVVFFLEKHTKYAAPSESTLRSKCLPTKYTEKIEKMRAIAAGRKIWYSVDESTDCEQRFVANFVFGVLDVEEERDKSYLFASAVLDAVNNSTIATFVDESLKKLSE